MVSYAAVDATAPELHALATSTPLRAKGLRFVLIDELMAHPARTRLARGLYRYRSAPRSTARRIRLFAAVCHQWLVATTRNQPPPPKPQPCPKRYNLITEASPWPPWTDLRWLWTR